MLNASRDEETQPEIDSLLACEVCRAPIVPKHKRHTRTCGRRICRDVVSYRDTRRSPEALEREAARNARWIKKNGAYNLARTSLRKRGLLTEEARAKIEVLKGMGRMATHEALALAGVSVVEKKRLTSDRRRVSIDRAGGDTWAARAPAIDTPLLFAASLGFVLRERAVLRVRDHVGARFLHGALHRVLDIGHSMDETPFALALPTSTHRTLWFITADRSLIDRLPARVILADDPASHELVKLAVSTIKAPRPRDAGQHRARLTATWPLSLTSMSSGRRRMVLAPETLVGALERVAKRAGLLVKPGDIVANVLRSDLTEVPGGMFVGGSWRTVACALGSLDVECNAVGRWLLDLATMTGIGHATAIGFGRVRVEDL